MSIRVSHISKEYDLGKTKVKALNDVSLRIERGEFVALIGPSGSGKSTLLQMLGALDKPDCGQVWIGDELVGDKSQSQLAELRLNKIGFIFQSFNLIPALSVYGNVEFPLLLLKLSKAERQKRVMETLEMVGLGNRMNHRTEELSGGQRQRVAIARALVTKPEIILSDEPTANLDSETGAGIIQLMQDLNREQGVTLVFATHDHSIVAKAKHIVQILDGNIQEETILNDNMPNASIKCIDSNIEPLVRGVITG